MWNWARNKGKKVTATGVVESSSSEMAPKGKESAEVGVVVVGDKMKTNKKKTTNAVVGKEGGSLHVGEDVLLAMEVQQSTKENKVVLTSAGAKSVLTKELNKDSSAGVEGGNSKNDDDSTTTANQGTQSLLSVKENEKDNNDKSPRKFSFHQRCIRKLFLWHFILE
jgi:hypothetical protein